MAEQPSTIADEVAEQVSQAFLAPIKAIGEFLAEQIDATNKRLGEIEARLERAGL